MAVLNIRVFNAAFTQAQQGAITTALNTVMINHGLSPTSISWEGVTRLSFTVSKDAMTYAQFQAFRTELETAAGGSGTKIEVLHWLDE